MTAAAARATAYYVYGVTRPDRALPALDGAGLDPEFPPELVIAGPLGAIASRIHVVEPDEPADPDAERALARVLAHERVLERLLDEGLPVVPFRFGTACAGAEDVTEVLRSREAELVEALARVEGRVELGVKAYVDPARLGDVLRASDERLPRLEEELAGAGPGASHLRRKQLERLTADAAAAERSRRAADLHERLATAAVSACTNRLPEREDERQPVLNGAYLVDRGDEDAFRHAAEAAAAAHEDVGMHVDVTGPWPAYNFVEADR